MTHSIRLRAFAKINLGLKVLARRSDGYHEIRTVYQTLALCDRLKITLTSKPGIAIQCQDPTIPTNRRNLVYRACDVWKKERKFKGGIAVALQKNIPAGGGLGGGSSDAAAALLGLERLTGDSLDAMKRFRLAAGLGSDVPLFLVGGRVLGCGRGEEIYPLSDLPARRCLVAYPCFAVSTPRAYRRIDLKLTTDAGDRKVGVFGVWSQFPLQDWGPAENDFENVVFAQWPELGQIKDQFIRAGAETASLTGSGSAIYALFDSARQLVRASRIIPRTWSVFRTRTLSRREYHRLIFEA